MKKLFALLLSFVLFLGIGTAAFGATEVLPAPPPTNVSIEKTYSLPWSGISPAEGVSFNITPLYVTDSTATEVPAFSSPFTINVPVNKPTGNFGILTFPTYTNVGKYYYLIEETPGTTAGVTYNSDPVILEVAVVESAPGVFTPLYYLMFKAVKDGENWTKGAKISVIENTYKASSLAVSKTIAGNFGDKSKYFDVTVTFTLPTGKTMGGTISYAGGKYTTTAVDSTTLVANIQLKHGDTVTFTNIPEGVTWTVAEADYTGDGYTTTYLPVTPAGTIDTKDADTAAITNTRNQMVETGISLDSLPYILLLAGAVAGLGILVIRRRRSSNF